jgi:microcystin-dependent protein
MDAFIGEVRAVGFNWFPEGWLPCDGRTLNSQQYAALYAILGNTYGGTAPSTFALPNLNGTVVTGVGQGPGLTNRVLGEGYGAEQVALTNTSMANHTHVAHVAAANDTTHPDTVTPGPTVYIGHLAGAAGTFTYAAATSAPSAMAGQILAPQGSGTGHENRQPYLVMNYIICWQGQFPPHP